MTDDELFAKLSEIADEEIMARNPKSIVAVGRAILAAGASEGQAEHCAEIIDGWQIVYAGTGPVKPVIEKHGLKIGSKLYAHPSAELTALRERIAGMEKDAARYRRIRLGLSDRHGDVYAMIFAPDGDYPEAGEKLDEAVDAAIAKEKQA